MSHHAGGVKERLQREVARRHRAKQWEERIRPEWQKWLGNKYEEPDDRTRNALIDEWPGLHMRLTGISLVQRRGPRDPQTGRLPPLRLCLEFFDDMPASQSYFAKIVTSDDPKAASATRDTPDTSTSGAPPARSCDDAHDDAKPEQENACGNGGPQRPAESESERSATPPGIPALTPPPQERHNS
jgi:hypothetical protein